MSCIIEKHGDLMWYCGECKEGPLSLKLCGMCCECGHKRCQTSSFPLTPVDSEDDYSAKNRKGKKRRVFPPYTSKIPLKQDISPPKNLDLVVATKEFRFSSPIGQSKRIDGASDAKIQLTPQIFNTNPYSSPAASTTSWETVCSSSPCSSTASSEDEDEDEDEDKNDEIGFRQAAQAQYTAKQNSHSKFDATSAAFVGSTCGGEPGAISVPNVSMTGNASASASQNRASKRSRGNGSHPDKDDEEGEDEDEDEDGDRKKRRGSVQFASDKQEQSANFACPFLKHSYTKYSMTSCRNHSSSIPRLKEHLYRRHRLQLCQRCKVGFPTISELEVHLQVTSGCKYRDSISENAVERVTPEMEKRLRNRTGLHLLSKPQQWYGIYKIIFGTTCTLSPYFEDIDNERSRTPQPHPNRTVRDFAQRLLPMFETLMEKYLRGTEEVEIGRLLESLDEPAIESAIQTALNQLLPPHLSPSLESSCGCMPHEDIRMQDQSTSANMPHSNDSYTEFTDLYEELQRANPSQTLTTDASPSAFRDSFNSTDTISFNSTDQDTECQPSSIIPISQTIAYQDTYVAEHEPAHSTRLKTASAVNFLLDQGHDTSYLGIYLDPEELFSDCVASTGYVCDVGTGDEGDGGVLYGDMDEDWGLGPIT